jgi:tripartite-type tricarboxylate transporter receptor subunit TctC
MRFSITSFFALSGLLIGALGPVEAAEFYKGKRLTLIASGGAGGGYDNYTRLLGRHLPGHIPGKPGVKVQNMNAAGGLVLANYTYNKAPKDGTFLGNIRPSVLFEQLFGNKQAKFDGRKFQYVGNMNEDTDACLVWHKTGATSIKDFYTRELIMGGSGRSAMSFSFPAVFNAILGTKFKIILGYRGTPVRILSMERGELHGACGLTTTTIKARLGRQLKEGKIRVLAIAGNNPDPAFKHVPNMLDQAKGPEDRAALKFLFSQMQVARMFAAPPGTPKDRVAILRKAFAAAMKDPAFIKDAKRTKTDVVWSTGTSASKVVDGLYASDPEVVARVSAALKAKAAKRKLTYYTVKTKILKTKRKGGRIYFKEKDKRVQASVSGKKTKVTIGGKKAKKSKIKKGMTCAINFAGPYTRAKKVDCE